MKNFLKRFFRPAEPPAPRETTEVLLDPPLGDTPDDLTAVVLTDLGNIRKNNEDTGLFVRLADEGLRRLKGYLLLVADGMGGHLAGEVASQMAAELVSREYFQHRESIEKSLARAFQVANKQIVGESRLHETFRGMGTTCTAVVVHGSRVYFAHVGDSRAYLFKNGRLVQLTQDHTYVQELLRNGEISEQQALTHPDRNVLLQALGTKPDVSVDLGRCVLPFDAGDRLLLCSDGLSEYCREEDFVQFLGQNALPDAAEGLLALAKNRGGHDNITLVLAERPTTQPALAEPRQTRELTLPTTREITLAS